MVSVGRRRPVLLLLLALLVLCGGQLGAGSAVPAVHAATTSVSPAPPVLSASTCDRAELSWMKQVQYYLAKGFAVIVELAGVQGAQKSPGPQGNPLPPRTKYLPFSCS